MAKRESNHEEQPEILDESTVQAIKEGLKSEEGGHFLTLDQAVRVAKERREAWQTVPRMIA